MAHRFSSVMSFPSWEGKLPVRLLEGMFLREGRRSERRGERVSMEHIYGGRQMCGVSAPTRRRLSNPGATLQPIQTSLRPLRRPMLAARGGKGQQWSAQRVVQGAVSAVAYQRLKGANRRRRRCRRRGRRGRRARRGLELHHERLGPSGVVALCQREALSKAGCRPLSPIPAVPVRVRLP